MGQSIRLYAISNWLTGMLKKPGRDSLGFRSGCRQVGSPPTRHRANKAASGPEKLAAAADPSRRAKMQDTAFQA